jgi:undecaprenyl-diphosphatase
MRYVAKHSFYVFVFYRVALGGVLFALLVNGRISAI